MLGAALWNGARGWLTPPVLFVLINLVIGTIAVMSRLMSATTTTEPGGDGTAQQRSLMRAPSVAFDRLRCFSFSRFGLPAFDDGGAAAEPASPVRAAPQPDGGEWRGASLLRAPSVALDRLRAFSFSRGGPAHDDDESAAPVVVPSAGATDAEPSAEEARGTVEHEQAGIERSQSEAAAVAVAPARRRRRARRSGREERADDDGRHGTTADEATGTSSAGAAGRHELPPVEVDARADDFIRQFREQLRLQRLDSILRYKDTLRRTGTV